MSVENIDGLYDLTVDDSADPEARFATIDDSHITDLAPAIISYDTGLRRLLVKGGPGGNRFFVNNTRPGSATTLESGAGNDSVGILGTAVTSTLTLEGVAGSDSVGVGYAGSLATILGNVTIHNAGGTTALTVDDSANPAGATGTIASDQMTGLAPATIAYDGHLSSLAVNGGSGGNAFTVASTLPAGPMTVNAGLGGDIVNVLTTAAGGPLTIDGQGGRDSVYIGQSDSAQGILGPVNVRNSAGESDLIVNDAADETPRTAQISATGITGLSPAPISFVAADAGVLAVYAGSGGNTLTVEGTIDGGVATINTGVGADTVTIQATGGGSILFVNGQAGTDAVMVGAAGSVQSVLGNVVVTNGEGQTALTADDSADETGRTMKIDGNRIVGLAPGWLTYGGVPLFNSTLDLSRLMPAGLSGVNLVSVKGGLGSDTFDLTPASEVEFDLNGGEPRPPALPGDTLALDLSDVTDPALTDSFDAAGYAGAWTFGNRQPVHFAAMETLNPTADLRVDKSANAASVVTGDIMTYTVSIRNAGPNDAENVVLRDSLPAQVEFQSVEAPEGWSCVAPEPGTSGIVRCEKGSLGAGSSEDVLIVVKVGSWPASGTMDNLAEVTSTTADSNPADNTATATVQVLPRLSLQITAERDVLPATWVIRYTITVTNQSNSVLPEIVVTDPLPDLTLFVQAMDGGERTDTGVAWHLLDVPAGATRVVHVQMWTHSTFRGEINNVVTASAYGFSISANKMVRVVAGP